MNVQEHDIFKWHKPRRFKVFFVEIDDDNRERVISAIVDRCSMAADNENYVTEDMYGVIHSFSGPTSIDMELKLVPSEDGTLFKWENFADEEEE